MTTIADLTRLGPNQLVQGFEATVTKAWPAETKEGNFGPYVTQNVVLTDGQTRDEATGRLAEIRCRVMDPPAGSLNDREVIRISAYQDPKTKGWKGAMTTSYQGKLQLDVKGKAVQVIQAQSATTAPGTAAAPSRANGAYPRALEMPGDPPEQRRPQAPVQQIQQAFEGSGLPVAEERYRAKAAAQAMTEREARGFFLRNMSQLLQDCGYLVAKWEATDAVPAEMMLGGLETPPPHVLELLGAWVTSMFIATKPSRDGVHVKLDGAQ